MTQIATRAIVLRRVDYNEADRIVTILSADLGKVAVLAKGVRRLKSKLAGGLELFAVNELTLIKGRGDLYSLRSARMKTNFNKILESYERSEQAFSALKQISKLVEDSQGQDYFELVAAYSAALNNKLPLELLELWWSLRLMSLLGHAPNLTTDDNGNKLNSNKNYVFDAGSGVFCQSKPRSDDNSLDIIKLWRLCLQLSPQGLSRVTNANKLAKSSLRDIMLFVANHT